MFLKNPLHFSPFIIYYSLGEKLWDLLAFSQILIIIEVLKSNNVKTLGQLSNKTRTDLRNYGFEHYEINKIDIELQLLGLGLKN